MEFLLNLYRFSRGVDPAMTLVAMNRFRNSFANWLAVKLLMIITIPIQIFFTRKKHSTLSFERFWSIRVWTQSSRHRKLMKRIGSKSQNHRYRFCCHSASFRGDISIKERFDRRICKTSWLWHIPEKLPTMGFAPSAHANQYLSGVKLNRPFEIRRFQWSF